MEHLESPVYSSILTPPLTLGIPNSLFLLLLISGMAIVISMGQWWFIAPLALCLIIGRVLTSRDIYAFEIIKRLIKLPEVMD
jgi:type IV secretory pathway VirB3-like protein